ncbi:MAG: hypothetical protein II950_01215 [Prevotella sp.]|nr:hypothetical protein [Prevotella sp.]
MQSNERLLSYYADVKRIVVGSDGSWYYTPDHYKTFIKFKP